MLKLFRTEHEGAVLIVLLWVLIALSVIALSLGNEVRVEVAATRNRKVGLQDYYLARAGIATSIHKLLKRRTGQTRMRTIGLASEQEPTDIDLGLVTTESPNGKSICEIEDESGKINVNNLANEQLLRKLMVDIGVESLQADTIVDSILDWIDTDNLKRLNGAEDEYYLSLPTPYKAKNAFLDSIEELLLVKGVTPEIFYGKRIRAADGQIKELYGLVKYLSVYSAAQININSASIPVLMSIPGISPDAAREIYEARKIRPFRNMQEVTQRISTHIDGPALSRVNTFNSNTYTIKAIGQSNGSSSKRVIRTVINLNPAEKLGYKVLYWNENANY